MKRLIIIIAVLLVVLGVAYQVVKKVYHVDKEAVITQIKPPSQDITKSLPQGSNLNTPLTIPQGFRIAVFANLKNQSPRVITFDPNNVVVASTTSNGNVLAFPDRNTDGIADETITILSGLNRPHGLVFYGGYLYVGETNGVSRYNYDPNTFKATNKRLLFNLPGGGRHFTRTIRIQDNKLYTSVGSSCDVCVESDNERASVLVSDLDGNNLKIYAKGLRNTVFFTFDEGGRMWGNDMGRDYLGDNLPPDELNIILDGNDYGWPWCYGDKVRDLQFRSGQNSNYCDATTPPVYQYPAHVAPLGITFINSDLFSKDQQGSILSAFHGSWNRSSKVGYKIVELTVKNGQVVSMQDFITGWLNGNGEVLGRPVDLVFSSDGILYISDDKANLIYILTKPN